MVFNLTDVEGMEGADILQSMIPGWLAGLIVGLVIVALIVGILIWVYTSLAFMGMGRKARDKLAGLAWIPGVGPGIIAFRASKMHWWPWLLLIGIFIPFVSIVAMIIFGVYAIIWQWKLFEAIDRPGWWSLIQIGMILPFIGILFGLAYLVLIGIAAWSK